MKHDKHHAVIPGQSCSPRRIDMVVHGYKISQVLRAALEVGLFTSLKRSCTCEEVSNRLRTAPELTKILLGALVALGFVKRSGKRYEDSEEAREFLDCNSPLYQGHFIMLQMSYYDLWNRLSQALKGNGVESTHREPTGMFDRLSTQAMAEAAMRRSLHMVVERVLRDISEFTTADSLLDMGGGHGLYSVMFTQTCPELKAYVFDLPQVIEVTKEFITKYGVNDRVHVIPGYFTKDDLGNEAYDIVFTSHVLYRYACNEELLRKLLRALKDGGLLIVSQWMKRKEPNLTSALWDIGLFLRGYSESALYTLDEFRSILTGVGFHVERTLELMVPYDLTTIVVSRKAMDEKIY